jgi:hypothetical protein
MLMLRGSERGTKGLPFHGSWNYSQGNIKCQMSELGAVICLSVPNIPMNGELRVP